MFFLKLNFCIINKFLLALVDLWVCFVSFCMKNERTSIIDKLDYSDANPSKNTCITVFFFLSISIPVHLSPMWSPDLILLFKSPSPGFVLPVALQINISKFQILNCATEQDQGKYRLLCILVTTVSHTDRFESPGLSVHNPLQTTQKEKPS